MTHSVLLPSASAARAWSAVEAIAGAIASAAPDDSFGVLAEVGADPERQALLQLSLGNGWAGAALLFDALDHARPDRGYDAVAMRLLGRAIAGAPDVALDASLHAGFVGIAFATEVVVGAGADDDAGADVDTLLAELLARPWRGDLDVIDGLAGVGAYLLERRRAGRAVDASLERIVGHLETAAVAERGGLTWLGRQGLRELGLAHGTAGIVAFLAKLHRAGIEAARVRPLLDGGAAWLRSYERAGEQARFPGAIARSGRVLAPRHGWCSGDLSVATALLAAARATGDGAAADHAVEIALGAAVRAPAEAASVDASLCHGAAGAAHLLRCMYLAHGDPRLADAARRWIDRALACRRDDVGVGGFLVAEWEGEGARWIACPGLLLGAAGTALALLAALGAGGQTRWDRAFLLGDA